MKKLTLSVIVLLTVVFFSFQKVNAQTDPECYRAYQNEEYKCLQTRTKCIQSCSSINNLKACMDSCSAQDKICSDQASADLKACLAAIPKSKVNSSTTAVQESTKPNAQTKNITCEEWKKIVGTEKCKYSVVTSTVIGDAINPRRDPSNSIWCSDTVDIGDTYINLPVDYKYATSDEQCIYDVNANLYSEQETNNAESTGFQQSTTTQTKELEEPAGRGIGEFIRKIQSLRLNPFDKSQDQVGDTDQKTPAKTIDDWIMENHLEYNPAKVEQMERERNELYRKNAELKETMFKKAQEVWQSEMIKLQAESLVEPKFEFLWEGEWPNVKTVVFDTESGVIIKSDSWRNIYLQDLADQVTKKVALQQGEIEVKVINENPTENKVNVEVDGFFDIFVIQTHFRVKYDPDKKLGVVNVYEGEVEVKTKDGKTVKVKPDGDKPGVVVVTQKLSVVRLAVIGVVLAVAVGSAIWFLKKKTVVKSSKKR